MADTCGPRPQARQLRAYAKVNLYLQVLGRRADGFHDIRTLFQTVSLYDALGVRMIPASRPAVRLACSRTDLRGPDNLAWRAADLMLNRTGMPAELEITLHKSIPSGAGLGGGSSDAAAVIRAVASLLATPPPTQLLFEVAAELGSDVPFFLVGGCALGTGRGAELEPLPDLPSTALVIARPPLEVSTAWAYELLSEARARRTDARTWGIIRGTVLNPEVSPADLPSGSHAGMFNDFESVVFRCHPSVAELKCRLQALGAQAALMSGTGAAVFGVFDSYQSARRVAGMLHAEGYAAWSAEYVGRAASGMVDGS